MERRIFYIEGMDRTAEVQAARSKLADFAAIKVKALLSIWQAAIQLQALLRLRLRFAAQP